MKPITVAGEGGRDPEMLELCVSEVAKHRLSRNGLHGQSMMRTLPGIELHGVTAGT
jgi:hypothetical protein